jgi:hypothetical protein
MANDFAKGFTFGVIALLVLLGIAVFGVLFLWLAL